MKKPKPGRAGAGTGGTGGAGGGAGSASPQPGHNKGRGHGAGKKPAKPAHVPASVRQARHKAALAGAKTRAKNAAKAKHHPKRKLALGEGVACCSAEALAASLRLAGWPVGDADVLALYWRTACDPDTGATIEETLRAARESGLAGVRPARFQLLRPGAGTKPRGSSSALVLGLELPGGPHALTLDDSGAVWSWGELHDPRELGAGLIEESWLVDWEA